jgi:nucleotide-binding universal stress UspA family protein
MPDADFHGLVVGVDESRGSKAALAFAMREAGRRGSGLQIVTVWRLHESATDMAVDRPEQARERAQEIQDVAVTAALSEVDARPVLMRTVASGDAGEILCEIAKPSDYLVVGSVEERSTRTTLLGSVSDYCLRHAACAVVVVPPAASLPVAGQESGRTSGGELAA